MIVGAGSPAGEMEVVAPYDRSLIGLVETCDHDHIEQALQVADALFRQRDRWLSLSERMSILERLAELMRKQVETLALDAAEKEANRSWIPG